MSDPRLNDPRFDPRLNDPVLQRSDRASGAGMGSSVIWAWIGGIVALVVLGILVLGNWHTGTDTGTPVTANIPALNSPAATTPGSAPVRNVTPPTTTGSGATSPAPAQPSAPASNNQ
ncbi:MAG: hypothetical protein WC670_18980 [Pseudolabrys sp.]